VQKSYSRAVRKQFLFLCILAAFQILLLPKLSGDGHMQKSTSFNLWFIAQEANKILMLLR